MEAEVPMRRGPGIGELVDVLAVLTRLSRILSWVREAMAATSQQSPSMPWLTSNLLAPPVKNRGFLQMSWEGREEMEEGRGEMEEVKEGTVGRGLVILHTVLVALSLGPHAYFSLEMHTRAWRCDYSVNLAEVLS